MENCLLFSLPGGGEWIVIGVAVLLFFGGRKIPEFMRGLGKGIREFNDAKNGVKEELENSVDTNLKEKQNLANAKASVATTESISDKKNNA